MSTDQELLLAKAIKSRDAAQSLLGNGYVDASISRAYYAMFNGARAVLLEQGLRFKPHSATHSAFGTEVILKNILPKHLHTWLIDAWNDRVVVDYDVRRELTLEDARAHVENAAGFLDAVQAFLLRARS
ncbi:MAG: HEPN domain-containing protein [Alphaproteobacteria bacterium]|nr:HEPN domain-containing protein [Alphaproteobacteria bacterium]